MTQDEARDAILREWRELPVERRVNDREADDFAMQVKDRFQFEASGDKFQLIRGWLINSFGMP